MPQTARLSLRSTALLILLALLWGMSFPLTEIALTEVPPFTLVLFRTGLGALVLWGIVLALRLPLPRRLRDYAAFAVMGLLNNAIPFGLIIWGQTQIEGGMASILNATTAIFGVVVAALFFADERLALNRIAGAVLGVAGVAVIIGPEAFEGLSVGFLGKAAVIAASVSYAFASSWGKAMLSQTSGAVSAALMVSFGALWMSPLALLSEGAPSLDYQAGVWAAVLIFAVISTSLAYLLYFAILRLSGASNLMLVTLLIPPVAVTLGAVLLGESLPLSSWLGFGIIACGLLLIDGRIGGFLRRAGR